MRRVCSCVSMRRTVEATCIGTPREGDGESLFRKSFKTSLIGQSSLDNSSKGSRISISLQKSIYFTGYNVLSGFQCGRCYFSSDTAVEKLKTIERIHFQEILSKKDWFILLNRAFVANLTFMNPSLVLKILRNQENPLYSLKFYLWVSNVAEDLAKNHSIRRIMLDILVRKGPVIMSAELLREIRNTGCQISLEAFCVLICSWGRLGLSKYCLEVFGQMSVLGFRPNTRIYNALIDALVESNSLDLAYFKFQQMAADSCIPDRFTYNILIHGVCKDGIMDEAIRLLNQMETSGYHPNVFTYTILINGFCKTKNVEMAFQIFETMKKRNLVPTEATFRSLIHGIFRAVDHQKAYDLLSHFLEEEPLFNEYAFNTVFYCLSKNKMARNASELLIKMSSRGYFPDSMTFSVIMACFMKSLDLTETCCILDHFKMQGGKPGFDTYLTLIKALFKANRDEEGKKYVDNIFLDGFMCNVVPFNMLIDFFCSIKMLDKAWEILHRMKENDVSPNLVTFNTLINGHCKVGEIFKARKLLKMIFDYGFKPDIFTFSSIIGGLCRAHQIEDAIKCFNEMVEWGVEPNAIIYNIMIRSLCVIGEIDKSIKLLNKMRATGITPNTFTFSALIICSCKMKKIDRARNLFDLMLRAGYIDETQKLLIKCQKNGIPINFDRILVHLPGIKPEIEPLAVK